MLGTFPKVISPSGNFPSGNFSSVQFPKQQLPKCTFGKMCIWEVAAWEIAHLRSCPWENAFGKVHNSIPDYIPVLIPV